MNVGGGRSVASVAVKNRLGKEKKMKAIKLAVGFVSVFVAGGVLGKTLTVRAEGLSERAKYVRRVTLNGRRVTARAVARGSCEGRRAGLRDGGRAVRLCRTIPRTFQIGKRG